MTEAPTQWKLRPFSDYTNRGDGRPMWKIEGLIDGSTFVIAVNGQRARIPTVEVASDANGPYAIVEMCKVQLADEFQIEMAVEDADFMSWRVFIWSTANQRRAAEHLGIDRQSTHVIAPPDQSRDLYFHADGRLELQSEHIGGGDLN